MVERHPYKVDVTSSSLVATTILGAVVQLVRIPACHAGGRGFESRPYRRKASLKKDAFFVPAGDGEDLFVPGRD